MKKKIRYTLLSKTVPEISKRDNTLYTCSIGIDHNGDLIRVYPLPPIGMRKWGTYMIEVERNKRDTRPESWKLASYSRKENWTNFADDILHVGQLHQKILPSRCSQFIYPSISRLNEDRKSIGIIPIKDYVASWQPNKAYVDSSQLRLFGDVEICEFSTYTKQLKEKESRILFKDGDGTHDFQLNEWQYYEYQRKYGAKQDAFRFINGLSNAFLLVGNLHNHRNVWIGLGVFNMENQLKIT